MTVEETQEAQPAPELEPDQANACDDGVSKPATHEPFVNSSEPPLEKPSPLMFVAVIAGIMVSFSFGYTLGITSPVFNPGGISSDDSAFSKTALNYEMNLSSDQQTWFGSVVNLSAGFGAVLCGYPIDRLGKKLGMLAANLCFILGWIIMLTTKAVEGDDDNTSAVTQLYFSRIVTGFGIAFCCNSVANYMVEISTVSLRGTIGNGFQLGITFGFVIVYLLGLYADWRTLAIVCLCVNSASFISVLFLPESPTWLISKGRKEEAHAALAKFRSADSNIEGAIAEIEEALEHTHSAGGLDALIHAPRAKALSIGIGLMVVQQLCGINAVMFYASYILGIVWPDPDTANKYALGLQVVQFSVTFASGFFMDKLGRVKMLTIAGTGLIVCCAVMNIYFFNDNAPEALVVVGLYGYAASFACGMGAIPWLVMGEMFHPEVKSVASSIATFVNWMLAFLVTKTVQNMQDGFGGGNSGMGWVFSCYGIVCIVGVICINIFVPETKGLSYESVEKLLLGEKEQPEENQAPEPDAEA